MDDFHRLKKKRIGAMTAFEIRTCQFKIRCNYWREYGLLHGGL